MSRDELLESLLLERYGTGQWFTRHGDAPAEVVETDSELACAARRRALADEFERGAA